MIRIILDGEPVPYSTRITIWGGRIGSQKPNKLKSWQARLTKVAFEAMHGRETLDEALDLTIRIYVPIRGRMTKAERALAEIEMLPVAKKPDWDNISKAACDALTAAKVWVDDGRVSDATVRMRYSPRPRIEITILSACAATAPRPSGADLRP